jgi:hypothetical protein
MTTPLKDQNNVKWEIVEEPAITQQEALELLNGKVRAPIADIEPEE